MAEERKDRHRRAAIGRHQETYLDYIGKEAVRRGGAGVGAKGVVHELMRRDQLNLSPVSRLNGRITRLTKSNTAKCVDLVTMNGGKVRGREQLKDLASQAALHQLRKRLEDGDYRSVRMVGTRETATLCNAKALTKRVRSSGISSRTTTRVADNAGAKVRNKKLLVNNARDVGGHAAASGVVGGAIGAAASVVDNLTDLTAGTIGGGEYASRIAKAGLASGAASAAKTAAALAIKEGTKTVAKKAGREGLKKFAGSNVMTCVAFATVDQVVDTTRLLAGALDKRQYIKRSVTTVASTYGAWECAVLGATIGSTIPGIGSAIGGLVGGIIGSFGGGAFGKFFGAIFDDLSSRSPQPPCHEPNSLPRLTLVLGSDGTPTAIIIAKGTATKRHRRRL